MTIIADYFFICGKLLADSQNKIFQCGEVTAELTRMLQTLLWWIAFAIILNWYQCKPNVAENRLNFTFAFQRQLGCVHKHPDVAQFSYGFQHISRRKIFKKIKEGNTSFGIKNVWTDVCEEPLQKRAKVIN